MNDLAVCTIVSKNYFSYARAFTRSFLKHHPESKVFVLLVDRIDGYFDSAKEPFSLITIDDLCIPHVESFTFKYNIMELNTAVKPFFISYLLEKYDLKKLVYFDSDILIYGNLSHLSGLLDGHDIVLIPHITSPIDDFEHKPNEINFLNAGTYNLGFIAVSKNDNTVKFLEWWKARLFHLCLNSVDWGFFLDQKWIDLVPGLFEKVLILREPGYNLAYWNLSQRTLSKENGQYRVNGEPLFFYHFSGFNPLEENILSGYQSRSTFKEHIPLQEILNQYKELLLAEGYREAKSWPYAFQVFDNGIPISDFLRRIYHSFGDQADRFGNPFQTKDSNSLSVWLNKPLKKYANGACLTNLHYEVYRSSLELMRRYPDVFHQDFEKFARWLVHTGQEIYKLHPDFFISLKPLFTEKSMKPTILGKMNAIVKRRRSFPAFVKAEMKIKRIIGDDFFKRIELFVKSRIFKNSYSASSVQVEIPHDPRASFPVVREAGVNLVRYLANNSDVEEKFPAQISFLDAANIPYVISNFDIGQFKNKKISYYEQFLQNTPYDVNLVEMNDDKLMEFNKDGANACFKDRYNIAWWTGETSTFSRQWADGLNSFHEIWTFNSNAQQSLASKLLIPVLNIFPASDTQDTKQVLSPNKVGAAIRARLERIVELTKK